LYLNRYEKFILSRSTRSISDNTYTEKHHVLPSSIFPEFDRDKSNLIILTAREHFVAHLLLAKAVGGQMWHAAFHMCNTRPDLKTTSRIYDVLRTEYSIQCSINQTGSKNNSFGSMWITNGKLNTKINKDDTIPDGWRKGRVCTQNMIYITNGEETRRIKDTDTIPDRWRRGRTNCKIRAKQERIKNQPIKKARIKKEKVQKIADPIAVRNARANRTKIRRKLNNQTNKYDFVDDQKDAILILYPDYTLVMGPFFRKDDNRYVVTLRNSITNKQKIISYPKILMELKLNRRLKEDEVTRFIDGNISNVAIDNIELLTRSELGKISRSAINNKKPTNC
jgi:hypothetical protein